MKIVKIPEYLYELLEQSGADLSCLASCKELSSIVSAEDVAKYRVLNLSWDPVPELKNYSYDLYKLLTSINEHNHLHDCADGTPMTDNDRIYYRAFSDCNTHEIGEFFTGYKADETEGYANYSICNIKPVMIGTDIMGLVLCRTSKNKDVSSLYESMFGILSHRMSAVEISKTPLFNNYLTRKI